jgi:magnesium-transporting ATPase (P-type)
VSKNQQRINTNALLAGVIGQVGCLIVFIIFVSLAVGMVLDKFLGTEAIFTVILIVGSVPVALYLAVRLSLTAIDRAQQKLKEVDENDSGLEEKNPS